MSRLPLQEWLDSDGSGGPVSLAGTMNHLWTFWERKDDRRIALFHYADLLADLPGQLRRLADVLGIAVGAERIAELAAEATFPAMRSRADRVAPNTDVGIWHSTEDFFHRGTSGQWQEVFGPEELRRYDARVAELAPPDMVGWLHGGWLGATQQQPASVLPGQSAGPLLAPGSAFQ